MDFNLYSTLTFEEPDMTRFRNLAFAFDAIRTGGNMPCILNAANEVVVAAFLRDEIGFLQMSDVIEKNDGEPSFLSQRLLMRIMWRRMPRHGRCGFLIES